jgi:hypothetical protein
MMVNANLINANIMSVKPQFSSHHSYLCCFGSRTPNPYEVYVVAMVFEVCRREMMSLVARVPFPL